MPVKNRNIINIFIFIYPLPSITTSKLAKNSVCELDLIDGVVTTNKLGNKSVTGKKIADGTITLANLSAEVKAKLNS